MSARGKSLAWAAGALALVTVLLLMPLPRRWEGPWQSKLFDLGHVPLFFALTLFLWLVLKRSWAWAFAIALTLGALTELVQDWFGRTSSLADFVRDTLGAACAFVVVRAMQGPRTLLRLAAHALVLVALLAWPVADAAPRLLDAYDGYRAFPTLANFGSARQMVRWECSQAELERVPDPGQPSGWSGRLEMRPGPRKYPGAVLEPIPRDWSGNRRICCSFTVTDRPLVVVVSIRGRDANDQSTHYQFEQEYAPGPHTVWRALDTVAREAAPRPLDLSAVRSFQVFIYRKDAPRTVYLHRVWLE
jgi:VanZ family protein